MSVGTPEVPVPSTSILDVFDRISQTISAYRLQRSQQKLLEAQGMQAIEAQRIEYLRNAQDDPGLFSIASGAGAGFNVKTALVLAAVAGAGVLIARRF